MSARRLENGNSSRAGLRTRRLGARIVTACLALGGCTDPPTGPSSSPDCPEVAVALFRGGPDLGADLFGRRLEELHERLRELFPPDRVGSMLVPSRNTAAAQLSLASDWFASMELSCSAGARRMLVGHSLGGDTVRLSGNLPAEKRVMVDPIARELALGTAPFRCQWFQRELAYAPPPNLIRNFLREADLTREEIEACNRSLLGTGCDLREFEHCIAGYNVASPGSALNQVLPGTDHGGAMTEAIPFIVQEIEALLSNR